MATGQIGRVNPMLKRVGGIALALLFMATTAGAVLKYNVYTGKFDITGETFATTTLPASCKPGDMYIDTDADTDGSLYICTATDTWKENDDDGAGGGISDGDKGDITVSSSGSVWTIDNTLTKAYWTFNDNDGVSNETMLTIGDSDDKDNLLLYGRLGINDTTPEGQFKMVVDADYGEDGAVFIDIPIDAIGLHIHSSDSGAGSYPLISIHGDNVADKALQIGMEGDTLRRLSITANGNLEFGPGGATARDARLYRSGVSAFTIDDTASGAASLTVTGSVTATGGFVGDVTGNVSGSSGSTTGNAATATALATPRAIYGNNFDGTSALAQVIASTYGGTGNGFTKFTGPTTAEKTFTLPDSNATLLYQGISTIELSHASANTLSASGGILSIEGTAIPKGTGSSNLIAYWSGTNTVAGLATATYPSLTELSYVKGSTSAIQTQLTNNYLHSFTWNYPENPVDTDDNQSIWCNDTANTFTVTKLKCESDQTVNMMFQVDDGTPADMDSVDLVCDSTPATDTSLNGDATVAAGDCVDVATTSVSGSPTWASATFTGHF